MNNREFFSEFPPVNEVVWKQAIEKLLKGKDYKETLVWKTKEGIDLEPFYSQKDLERLGIDNLARGSENPGWLIGHNVDFESSYTQQVELSLRHGARALRFDSQLLRNKDLSELLTPLSDIDLVQINLDRSTNKEIGGFVEKWAKIEISKELPSFHLGFDPFKRFLTTGNWEATEEGDFNCFLSFWESVQKGQANVKSIKVDGAFFQNAGANAVQELAFSLSLANEFLRRLTENRDISSLQNAFYFNLCAGPNFHIELGKFRAFRLLWRNLLKAYDLKDVDHNPIVISAETAEWNKSFLDINNNLLRLTTEIMASAMGAADCIFAYPFDEMSKKSNDFSCRLSLNLQLMLKHESFIDITNDPAGGSYQYEHLTNELGVEAWSLFQKIEKQGGLINYARSGSLKEYLDKSKSLLEKDFEAQKLVLIGVNKYPNSNDKLDVFSETLDDKKLTNFEIEPIEPFRIAQGIEKERIGAPTKINEV